MKKEKGNKKNKAGYILLTFVVIGMLWASFSFSILTRDSIPVVDDLSDKLNDIFEDEKPMEWHTVAVIKSTDPLGEYNPGVEASGWLSFFVLDYGETPGTVLAYNATDWSSDATAMGYVDTDNTETELKANDPGYFVARVQYNITHCKQGGTWNISRARCKLNVGGDETVTNDYAVYGDGEDEAVESANFTDLMYVNFYWDDGSDGYRILSDGDLTWAIEIEAKF